MAKKEKRFVLFFAGLNCNDPSREAEFNEWYKVHIKEAIEHNGFLSGSRFEIISPKEGYPKYLAIYELEDEAAYANFMEKHRRRMAGLDPILTQSPPSTIIWWAAYKPI